VRCAGLRIGGSDCGGGVNALVRQDDEAVTLVEYSPDPDVERGVGTSERCEVHVRGGDVCVQRVPAPALRQA
jgi:hypothetical protein